MKTPVDDHIRRAAVETLGASIALAAGAGSGKTTLLADRVVELLLVGERDPRRVAAITFTEKAAGELARRIRDRLEGAAHPRRHEMLRRFGELTISTIHGFCRNLLIEEALDADWAPDTEVLPALFGEPAVARCYAHWRRSFEADYPEQSMELRRAAGEQQVREAALALHGHRDLAPVIGDVVIDWNALKTELRARLDATAALAAQGPATCKLVAKWSPAIALWTAAAEQADPEAAVENALGVDVPDLRGGSAKAWGPELFSEFKEGLKSLRGFESLVVAARGAALHARVLRDLHERLLPILEETAKAEATASFADLLFRSRALLVRRVPSEYM